MLYVHTGAAFEDVDDDDEDENDEPVPALQSINRARTGTLRNVCKRERERAAHVIYSIMYMQIGSPVLGNAFGDGQMRVRGWLA